MTAKGNPSEFKSGRLRAGLTQVEAASRLDLSQPYLSQLECGRRRLTARVARAMRRLYQLPPTTLPLPEDPLKRGSGADSLPGQLAALGYPGYGHVRASPTLNPAVVVLAALSEDDLDARLSQALPWVLVRYPDLNWDWLLAHVKLRNLQNRLGFLVAVSREFAETHGEWSSSAAPLREVERDLDRARLAGETTLSRETMPKAERDWLRKNRPPLAEHWNVLTSLSSEHLTDAA